MTTAPINYIVQLRPKASWSRGSLQKHLEAHGVVVHIIFSGNSTASRSGQGRPDAAL